MGKWGDLAPSHSQQWRRDSNSAEGTRKPKLSVPVLWWVRWGEGWLPHLWGCFTHVSPSSSARVATAMSADKGCSMEHTMGYRGVGRFRRGKSEPIVGVGYMGSKGPGQRKDVGEAKPADPRLTPTSRPSHLLCHLPLFLGPFFI